MICDLRTAIGKPVVRAAAAHQHSRRGVALIVTLIMLAVITFMATTFLVLSRRERNSVSTNTDQTTARFTADSALERAKSQLLAGLIAVTNDQNFDLMVPTNFYNPVGFNPALVGYSPTNVNYDYNTAGNPLSAAQQQQNIANLLYDPRPPVFITNTKVTNDFRYYLDLNRNGRFDDSGIVPNITNNAAGIPGTNGTIAMIGDPQWIGVLQFPDRPHSADNQFVSRWTYFVAPAGKTLDVNYAHNRAKKIQPFTEGFLRNQGVGTWEINLAAFLADLNTNQWFAANNYFYDTNLPSSSSGFSFVDANDLLTYRYHGSYGNLSAANLIFPNAAGAFQLDNIDEYSDGPLMDSTAAINEVLKPDPTTFSWSGADNTNHFFTTQDLFDPNKTSAGFYNRLNSPGFLDDTYNRYTFYRLLAQLGTDSSPPLENKININYRNVTNGVVVSGMETNLIGWTALEFFTNSAARMFEKLDIRDNLGNLITVTNIPIWWSQTNVSDNFYSPAVHRVLQLAANIFDASGQTNGIYPSIFRPVFSRANFGTTNQIYISGYELVNAPNDTVTPTSFLTIPLDLNDIVDNPKITAVTPPPGSRPNVYGAPWVIGVKKGFPNLNQIAVQSVSQMTRKLMITRPSTRTGWTDYHGKQMFVMGVSNSVAVEIWNAYNKIYPRPLYIQVDGKMTVELTNNVGFKPAPFVYNVGGVPGGGTTNLLNGTLLNTGLTPPNGTAAKQPLARSFVLPLNTNIIVLQDSIQIGNTMYPASSSATGVAAQWNSIPWDNLSDPHWGLNITNNLRCIVMDGGLGGRVVDYVQLNRMEAVRDLTQETLNQANKLDVWTETTNANSFWASAGSPMSQGVIQQLMISMGSVATSPTDWSDNGLVAGTKSTEIAKFQQFMYGGNVTTNTAQAPFTPTSKIYQLTKWQANDPLVHYLPEDLTYVDNTTNILVPLASLSLSTMPTVLSSMYRLNERYSPWGGYGPKTSWDKDNTADTHLFDTAIKDPTIMAPDNWDFPTNKFPSVGWLGRVHRGTPWQTVYMKSSDIMATASDVWQKWSGSANTNLAAKIAPIVDRQLFEIFTTSLSDNASRGQLSINQTNLAAWSALLSGVLVLTNDPATTTLYPTVISPAGIYTPGVGTLPPLVEIVQGISNARTNFPGHTFANLGDFLATPQLTDLSPYLTNSANNLLTNLRQTSAGGITDEVLERIPQQIMSLVTISHSPRFVVYSYGQTLHPANNSVLTTGPFIGLCTNYQVTAESATRAVIRVDGAPKHPHVVVEQYNVLPPD